VTAVAADRPTADIGANDRFFLLSLSIPLGSREDPLVVFSPRQVAVVALAVIACSHSGQNFGVTWRPPSGDDEGRGTFVMRQRVPLRYLELEVLRVSKRPDTDECALLFGSCPGGPAEHEFVVTTTPEQRRGCMVPYCGNAIDDLLRISWGQGVPRIAFMPTGVLISERNGEFHESTIEAAIEKLISGKDRPRLVILDALCPDPIDRPLQAIALLNQAQIRVLLTMFRHHPSEHCDDLPTMPKLE
jgi:hypothetical protein